MRRFLVLATFFGLLVSTAPPARAELASMVADLDSGAGPNRSSGPSSFVRLGPRVLFFADGVPWVTDGTPVGTARLPGDFLSEGVGKLAGAYLWLGFAVRGHEVVDKLWASDGTAAGTAALARCEQLERWVLSADRLYFFCRSHALEVWRTNGSAAGTKRIAVLPRIGEDQVYAAAVHGGQVYFVTAEYVSCGAGCEGDYANMALWRTDPASGRTRLLHRSREAGRFELYSTAGGLVFFPGDGGLWASDGTVGGTAPVRGHGLFVVQAAGTVAGKLYFSGWDERQVEGLWTCDGTGAGTRLVARGLTLRWHRADPLAIGDRYVFVASDEAHGTELWSTRGTPATTALVADLCPGPCSGVDPYVPILAAAGRRIFFYADDGVHGTRLWVTDGTRAGTRRIALALGDPDGLSPLHADGHEVFFYQRRGAGTTVLWASDGTTAGTRSLIELRDFAGFGAPPAPSLALLGSRIVTMGYDPLGGFEPWVVERGGQWARQLGDLDRAEEEGGSFPFDAVALDDRLLFMTESPNTIAAWSTRGTAETTVKLAEGPAGTTLPRTAVVGALAYFNLNDLWASDGTAAGTVRLTDFTTPAAWVSTAIVALDGRAVFGVTYVDTGLSELWTSDGAPEGTRRAGPPASPLSSFRGTIDDLTAAGGGLYFLAFDDASRDPQVWTAESGLDVLRRLTDLEPHGVAAPGFTGIGGHVFFSQGDGSLWRTDGTPEGTVQVPLPAVAGVGQTALTFAGLGDSVLLLTRPPVSSSEPRQDHLRLWTGDGSGADWVELRDFGRTELLETVTRNEDVLLLVREGRDANGEGGAARLYRTDGTAAGTAAIIDFASLGVGPASITWAGGQLFFAAGAEAGRAEPWLSGGTTATTRRLQEIAPGPRGSDPRGFTAAGSRIYFTADDGLHGRELWSLPLDELDAPCRPSATALCLGDGRFRAELFWHDRKGALGDGRAVPWSDASGAFWFYGYDNPEAAVKWVGGAGDSTRRLFFGPLGEAHVALTVTDLETGDSRRYPAEPGPLPAFVDFAPFPSAGAEFPESAGPALTPAVPESSAGAAGPCLPDATRLCLHGGRFAAELVFRDASGAERRALAFAHGDRAGYFSFGGARYVDAALKIVDRRAANGRFWLFTTSLTRSGYTLTVTETATGTVHRYSKPAGETSGLVDRSSLR